MPRRTATFSLHLLMLICASMVTAASGCVPSAEEQQRAQLRQDFRESFAHHDPTSGGTQAVSHPQRIVVAQGRSPVVFDVRVPAMVHIFDLTAGAEIASAEAGRDQWVSVNQDKGVVVGGRRVLEGPLPEGHEFAIQLETANDDSFQSQGGINAAPPPPPTRYENTTQPASPAPARPASQ